MIKGIGESPFGSTDRGQEVIHVLQMDEGLNIIGAAWKNAWELVVNLY